MLQLLKKQSVGATNLTVSKVTREGEIDGKPKKELSYATLFEFDVVTDNYIRGNTENTNRC